MNNLKNKLRNKLKEQFQDGKILSYPEDKPESTEVDSSNDTVVVDSPEDAKDVVDNNDTGKPVNVVVANEGEEEVIEEEAYNTYAICIDSIAKTAGTSERSKWSKADTKRYENCIKELKGKKDYTTNPKNESVRPKMSKKDLVEAIRSSSEKTIIKKVKVKDILK